MALVRQFTRLALANVAYDVIHLEIDDTVTLRASQKAPGSRIHHQHSNNINLPAFVQGQCWANLAIITRRASQEPVALPLLSRLMPGTGNTGKGVAANTLMRAVQSLPRGFRVCVLMDSWYMRQYVISTMLNRDFDVIGQVRRDTRLYDLPVPRLENQQGRSWKYGGKLTREQAERLPRWVTTLHIYGKEQRVRLRSTLAKARFLNGRLVRVVWCEFENDHKPGQWKTVSLLLSTDTTLTAEQIVESYSLRWSIEPMFNQLKQAWGIKEAWQQTRQTLHRWVHLTMAGYGLVQLLSCLNSQAVAALCQHSPWRKHQPQTAGQIGTGLVNILRHAAIRSWWNAKGKKFMPPDWNKNWNSGYE